MGANVEVEEVTLPKSLVYIWELHKSLRFSEILEDGEPVLSPRQPLSFNDILAYLSYNQLTLSEQEIGVIMSIDSTYDRFAGGNV